MALSKETSELIQSLDKLLLETGEEEKALIQTELGKFIPEKIRNSSPRLEERKKLSFKPDLKLRSFKKGENFARFCERFKEYIEITNVESDQLNLLFRQNLDEETYAKLSSIRLTPSEKCDSRTFCEIYKSVIYGQECTILKNEVLDCKQLPNECIDDYAFRLKEKAFIAFPDMLDAEQNATLAFYRGVRDSYMKRRLNEKSFKNFEEAVFYAKRLEKVEEMVNEKPEVTSILKESNVTFGQSSSGLSGDSEQLESSRDGNSFERQSRSRHRRDNSRSPSRTRSFERQNISHDRSYGSRSFNSKSPESSRSRSGSRSFQRQNGRWNGSNGRPRGNNTPNRNWSNNRPNGSETNARCWNCNRKGHMKRTCWLLNNNTNRGNDNSGGNSHLN